MRAYRSQRLGMTIDIPDGWTYTENTDFMQNQLDMSFESANATPLVLFKTLNYSEVGRITISQLTKIYPSLSEWKIGLKSHLEALTKVGYRHKGSLDLGRNIGTIRNTGIPFTVIESLVNGDDVLQIYAYVNQRIICFFTLERQSHGALEEVVGSLRF